MKHPENLASQKPDDDDQLSDIMQELQLLRERIVVLEASVFGSPQTQNLVPNVPVGHEQARLTRVHVAEADLHDAHITVQHKQGGNIDIAIRSPSTPTPSQHLSYASVCTSALSPMPNPTPSPPPPTQIPSHTICSPSSRGPMMTPREVQQLLALQPQNGEYYVVIKGRRPGVYLSWPDAHELIDGLRSPCHYKKADKHAALGQYTLAYQKGMCEYRFR